MMGSHRPVPASNKSLVERVNYYKTIKETKEAEAERKANESTRKAAAVQDMSKDLANDEGMKELLKKVTNINLDEMYRNSVKSIKETEYGIILQEYARINTAKTFNAEVADIRRLEEVVRKMGGGKYLHDPTYPAVKELEEIEIPTPYNILKLYYYRKSMAIVKDWMDYEETERLAQQPASRKRKNTDLEAAYPPYKLTLEEIDELVELTGVTR
jgi:hypothetical protein